MKKKLIITESQLQRLKKILNEQTAHSLVVKQLKNELDSNYEPIEKFVRKGGEYSSTAMVKVKTDEEEIPVKELYEYLKYKFNIDDTIDEDGSSKSTASTKFLKQVIEDWMFGRIKDDYTLSKNVPLK